ncbi:MAG: hypothetical protein CMJ06_01455 [Pelagibacterales bacterium]|nr:hypothetical protein [Pelagibacterales bacterium]OUU63330.1 MAG: hypothetical protein CBC22_01425 [Alphaproteobacteria bacterium TMED62]
MEIKIYNIFLYILFPFIIIFFFFRILIGKEDKNRFLEKLSFISKKRPLGNLIWFHACSVGEVRSAYTLIKSFSKNNNKILVTTNTYLSALDVKKNFTKNVIHQYLPLDLSFFIKKFLNHWRPNKAVFVESEIWPNLIFNTHKSKIPLFLIQARFSNTSLKRWKLFKSFFESILNKFSLIIPQSLLDKNNLENYTKNSMDIVANLKFNSDKLKFSSKEKIKLQKIISKKTIISAVSTHAGEEEIILDQIKKLESNNTLLILQPRHPNRNNKIISIIKKHNLSFKQRSKKQLPNKRTRIYLFDTFGETGLLMSISNIIIVGGTLVPIGGHNLIEAGQFGKSIIVGPYIYKIEEIVNYFKKYKAIEILDKNDQLHRIINKLINNKKYTQKLNSNAKSSTLNFLNFSKIILKKIGNIK